MIDPIAFHIPFLNWPVHYYGLFYGVSVLLTFWILPELLKKRNENIKKEKVWDLIFWIFLGGILGGRLGFFLFYHPGLFFSDQILKIWEGGMSFHGGLLGGLLAGIIFCKIHKINILKVADALTVPLSLSLALGRFGNFINGELVGRISESAICMNFEGYEGCRWPSQLFELGKNLLMALIFFPLVWRNQSLPDGVIFGLWLISYGILRFSIEFFREPDWIWLSLSGGQWLCIGMILGGIFMISALYWKKKK